MAILGLLLLSALPVSVRAHPPQQVLLEYDPELQQLNVSIRHLVADPGSHYISTVVIRKNDIVNITAPYTSQPTSDIWNYTYPMNATDGDWLNVTATCNVFGSLTASLLVNTTPPPPPPPVDIIPPTVHILYPENFHELNGSAVTVSGNASDNVKVDRVEVSLNNGTWELASGTTNWSYPVVLLPGSNFIRARAVDTSNLVSLVDFVYITYNESSGADTTPPAISIFFPAEGQEFNSTPIDVRGTASDDVLLTRVEVRVNNQPWAVAFGTTSWNVTVNLFNGTNLIEARATDNSSNTAVAKVNLTYEAQGPPPPPPPADTTPPSLAISSPSEDEDVSSSRINVTGTASDDKALSRVEVRVNRGAWRLATGTTSWTLQVTLIDGADLIEARATDTSDNTATASVNVTYTAPVPPDITPPRISITSPRDEWEAGTANIRVNGTASDDEGLARVEVRVKGGSWGLAEGREQWSATVALAEGSNGIEARATDLTGNQATASVTVIHARSGGTATLDGIVTKGEYDFTRALGDGAFTVSWRVKGDAISMALVGRTGGYVCIGFGPETMMKGADMVFGWVDGSGKKVARDCYSTGETGPHHPDTAQSPPGTFDILDHGATESGGTTTFEFRRHLSTGDRWDKPIPSNGSINIIWALGPDDDVNSKHSRVGYATLNITTGAVTERAPMAWRPHAVLMGTGLALLFAGMFIARAKSRKWWLRGHRLVMALGTLLIIGGLVYGFYMIQVSTNYHFRVPHSSLGAAALALAVLMPLVGQAALRAGKKSPGLRPAHRWLGRLTLLVLPSTVLSGLIQAGVIAY